MHKKHEVFFLFYIFSFFIIYIYILFCFSRFSTMLIGLKSGLLKFIRMWTQLVTDVTKHQQITSTCSGLFRLYIRFGKTILDFHPRLQIN